MSLLKGVEPEQAEGEIAAIYKQLQESINMIPNSMKMMSVNPMQLRQTAEHIGYTMNHPSLSPSLFTMIRLTVSSTQQCDYCITTNRALLMRFGMPLETIQAIEKDPNQAPLSVKEKALLLYTVKSIKDANSVGELDISTLRELGASDEEIFDALSHGARQVAADIMISAFKVVNDF